MAQGRSNPGHGQDSSGGVRESLEAQNAVLEKENHELRRFAQYRSFFLARLAHELRTPLTSILGFVEILLSQEELTEPQRGFCERIQNSAQQLQGNLNQLSDLSRLEGGQSALVREEFSLGELLRESCAAVSRTAHKLNVEVRWQAADGMPPIVSDRGKLAQVILNFLAYAITRSCDGTSVTVMASQDPAGFLLGIEDEGESMTNPASIGELESTDRRSGASELGLAIARHNIDLLSATLTIGNREPHGLEVKIQLPNDPPDMKHG